MEPSHKQEVLVDVMEAVETTDLMDLVVFNDDVNTFDHVIATLIRVCKHTPEQAEQCTFLIHYKGKLRLIDIVGVGPFETVNTEVSGFDLG